MYDAEGGNKQCEWLVWQKERIVALWIAKQEKRARSAKAPRMLTTGMVQRSGSGTPGRLNRVTA